MNKDTVRNALVFPAADEKGMTMQDLTRLASMMTLVSCGITDSLEERAEDLSEEAISLLSRKNGDDQ